MKMPLVHYVVIRGDDDRQPRVRVIVKVDELPGREVLLVLGKGLGGSVEAAVGEDALQRHEGGSLTTPQDSGGGSGGGGAARSLPETPMNSSPTMAPSGSC